MIHQTDAHLSQRVEDLEWDFVEEDTQYLTHSIHRYSGKFIPQIARQTIELLSEPGDTILDPYCGSGTTLLEATLTARRSVGIDMNPVAVLISKVKNTVIDEQYLRRFQQRLLENIARIPDAYSGQTTLADLSDEFGAHSPDVSADTRLVDEWYSKWFKQNVLRELIGIYREILREKNPDCRNVGFVAFSDILRKSSNANSSYPNVMFDKNAPERPSAIPRFTKRLSEIVGAVSQLAVRCDKNLAPLVVRANACRLPIPDERIDAVITHPPYIGSIPYAEYGALSIKWLGYDPKKLDASLTGGLRQKMDVVERFRGGFLGMIRESRRVLKPGKYLFMLLGTPTVKGQLIDLPSMAQELASEEGFLVSTVHSRNGINRRANLMGNETLLFFQKPK